MCTYLVERMLNDHLPISVGYARKQIPDCCVSLFVDVLLPLRNGLGQAGCCASGPKLVISESSACLIHDGLPDVVANSVQLRAESLGKPSHRLGERSVSAGKGGNSPCGDPLVDKP